MTFNVEFYAANAEDAGSIIAHSQTNLPATVRNFIAQALTACPTGPVYVKAEGHLYESSNNCAVSNCNMVVRGIAFRAAPVEAANVAETADATQ